jgi:hypothetical protein
VVLQDLENLVLSQLQQPSVNFGNAPTWSATTNPVFNQASVDFAINRGYARLLSDLADEEIAEFTASFLSTVQTNRYPLPPPVASSPNNPNNSLLNPNVRLLNRVSYQPVGLPYTVEFHAGTRFVSWDEFQRVTAQGYLLPYSYAATVPDICAVTPARDSLFFFPGSGSAGDTITLRYSPMWTVGSLVGPLVNETDVPYFPEDCHDAIAWYALSQLWIRAREVATSQMYSQMYKEDVERIKTAYLRRSRGDKLNISSREMEFATRSWPT